MKADTDNKKKIYTVPNIKIVEFGCDETSPSPEDLVSASGTLTDAVGGVNAYSAGQQSWSNIYGN